MQALKLVSLVNSLTLMQIVGITLDFQQFQTSEIGFMYVFWSLK